MDDLRSSMRKARRSLNAAQREHAAVRCAQLASACQEIRSARCIAAYMAYQGEMSCAPIIQWALGRGTRVLLPVVTGRQMRFAQYRSDEIMIPNRWGILEPACPPRLWAGARRPSVAFVPLVAFDSSGARLGQGGGYYDRAFAFRQHAVNWQRPLLVGLGYEFQRVEELAAKPSDVPLDVVITEHQRYEFRL